jgi:hypothetical protein
MDEDLIEYELSRVYGIKYIIEVISLSPAFMIWYVRLLQMVICVYHSCSMQGIAESVKDEFGCVLRSCHYLCAMAVCACYASHTMVAWYGCCRW